MQGVLSQFSVTNAGLHPIREPLHCSTGCLPGTAANWELQNGL